MAIKPKIDVKIKLRPTSQIMGEVGRDLRPPFIRAAQNAVAFAVINSPFDTGLNRSSLGWSLSELGQASFGTLTTGGAGGGVPGVTSDRDKISVLIAGTSGYSGWLEIGTRRMSARPYIKPGAERAVPGLKADLKGSVG